MTVGECEVMDERWVSGAVAKLGDAAAGIRQALQ